MRRAFCSLILSLSLIAVASISFKNSFGGTDTVFAPSVKRLYTCLTWDTSVDSVLKLIRYSVRIPLVYFEIVNAIIRKMAYSTPGKNTTRIQNAMQQILEVSSLKFTQIRYFGYLCSHKTFK